MFDGIENSDKIKQFIERPSQSLRGDYVRTVEIWSCCFPREQLFIGFFDDLVQDPQRFMLSVIQFLGAPALGLDPGVLGEKVNVSNQREIPEEIRYYLAQKYHPELQRLNTLVGGYCEAWLKKTEDILGHRAYNDALARG
jgi:hypothetical protein